jgi:hypothetical protein
MKAYGKVEVQLRALLTLAIQSGELQALATTSLVKETQYTLLKRMGGSQSRQFKWGKEREKTSASTKN